MRGSCYIAQTRTPAQAGILHRVMISFRFIIRESYVSYTVLSITSG